MAILLLLCSLFSSAHGSTNGLNNYHTKAAARTALHYVTQSANAMMPGILLSMASGTAVELLFLSTWAKPINLMEIHSLMALMMTVGVTSAAVGSVMTCYRLKDHGYLTVLLTSLVAFLINGKCFAWGGYVTGKVQSKISEWYNAYKNKGNEPKSKRELAQNFTKSQTSGAPVSR